MTSTGCTTDTVEELPSSQLGTKEHWDDTYEGELREFEERGDIGEVWFGEESEERVITWLVEDWEPSADLYSPALPQQEKTSLPVLDLGTGNGHFLLELAELGFSDLTGVDYSEQAVALARAAALKATKKITYERADLACGAGPAVAALGRQFAVCHDKGTYDAVSLTPDTACLARRAYLGNVHRLLADGGVFVITSCNWTEDELLQHCDPYFVKLHRIPTPSFRFGGKTGSLVTSLVLKKKPQPQL
ncbi:hypothetical protein HAZT_HAZT009655 [Hyalella azteca]|uniref:Protein-lysine N-methyltransferase HAZT_HAZT009655 n=1 Tax=Hyalella azteca TaxID=294128 RepID=A0A6A0H0P5_HYAAZ|nr:EEF1A lysine methyltransferase 2 [Hyalella azteca]KAA0193426.1 hypothetical protein HAZT_HAZT009655 [Hyalella azteca]